jgi:hypothetical protein
MDQTKITTSGGIILMAWYCEQSVLDVAFDIIRQGLQYFDDTSCLFIMAGDVVVVDVHQMLYQGW